MHTQIEPNGNLTFIMPAGTVDDIENLMARHGGNDEAFLVDLLDTFGFSGNAQFTSILPEDVGALTCAPMLSDDVDYLEDGSRAVRGDVWWYPDYQLRHFGEVLLRDGRVTFTKAH